MGEKVMALKSLNPPDFSLISCNQSYGFRIYTIAEIIATVMDCIILFVFLIYTLSYKPFPLLSRIAITACFFLIMLLNIAILNYHFVLEGAFSILYFIVLFGFSRFVLQGKWLHQLVLILLGFGSLFVTNTAMLIASSVILKEDYSNIILMRNPARVFLLFLSKLTFVSILLPISNYIKKKKLPLQLTQSFAMIISLLVTIVVGTLIEKMILNQLIPVIYANIMMISLAIIDILLFYILIQFSPKANDCSDHVLRNEQIYSTVKFPVTAFPHHSAVFAGQFYP